MRQKLNIVTLGVNNFIAAVDFYQKGLGWQPSAMSQESIVFFDLGGVVLALYPRELLAEDVGIAPAGQGFSGITLAHNAKSKEEVDAVLKQVEGLGAKIVKPAQTVFWGGYSGYFSDLDGYLWEVAWNPYFEFDDQDNLIMT
ncbi:VOC family protein [Sporomusa sp.]|uniref:VOC family protein n=1 Tax=Sporomusa sp. TaxID=2078658 RepID=UPI002B58657A|nr:VOC family protein [Sporomusa sp.]HWR07276.1 VOC family protein [Sporomusa sp.]